VPDYADDNDVNKGPTVEHMRRVVGLFAALARGSRHSIPELTSEMTLEQGTLACFAVGQLLMQRLVMASGKSLEDVAAQLALEVH
jgi:ribose 1,5-bisphosphokinase PhnN